MNYYSDQIINHIVDNDDIDKIIDNINNFIKKTTQLLVAYSINTINSNYINNILNTINEISHTITLFNKSCNIPIIVYYCIDTYQFDINNSPSILIYQKHILSQTKHNQHIQYYILYMCTKHSLQGQGYGFKLLNNFIDRVINENHTKTTTIEILVSSLDSAGTFYEKSNFIWLPNATLTNYPIFMKYELFEKNKEYFIFNLIIKIK